MIWADQGPLSFLGLALLGFSLAPIYPLLISETPRRLGAAQATHAIGFQVSAAYLGTAALPGAAGVLARWHGLEVIGLVLVSAAAGLLTLHEMAVRHAARGSSRPRRGEEPAMVDREGRTGLA
jgi:fucose permease